MWDYQSLHALEAIVRYGSFQAAAKALHLTQSAISQRIRILEEQAGARLLIRGQPARPTSQGALLLNHVNQVLRLEEGLALSLRSDLDKSFVTLTLGINSDSLATWFYEAVTPILKDQNVLLDLIIENEGITFSRLQKGEVIGCISSRSVRLPGCEVEKLGIMSYKCAATPYFIKKYFPNGLTLESLTRAPAVIFDLYDNMHSQYFERYFNFKEIDFPLHRIGTSHGFLDCIRYGLAYGMAPSIQAKEDFKSGQLVDLAPKRVWKQELYWHHQRREDKFLRKLSQKLVSNARKILK